MAWYSILPPQLLFVESWAVRIFLLLGLVTIGPWLALVVFDILLYVWRMATFEIPVLGGRARGRQRPNVFHLQETAAANSPRRFFDSIRASGSGSGSSGGQSLHGSKDSEIPDEVPQEGVLAERCTNSAEFDSRGRELEESGVRRREYHQ